MAYVDPNDPEMQKHVRAAMKDYLEHPYSDIVLKHLRNRELSEQDAKLVLKEAKSRLKGPNRKKGLIKAGIGLALVMLTYIIMIASQRFYWYIGGLGLVMLFVGLFDCIFGTTDPRD